MNISKIIVYSLPMKGRSVSMWFLFITNGEVRWNFILSSFSVLFANPDFKQEGKTIVGFVLVLVFVQEGDEEKD